MVRSSRRLLLFVPLVAYMSWNFWFATLPANVGAINGSQVPSRVVNPVALSNNFRVIPSQKLSIPSLLMSPEVDALFVHLFWSDCHRYPGFTHFPRLSRFSALSLTLFE